MSHMSSVLGMSKASSRRQSFAQSDVSDDDSIPDEKDWKHEIDVLQQKTGYFNVNNYTHILSEEEKKSYDKIIQKIPVDRRVYIQ